MTDQPKKLNVRTASTVLANHRRELFAQLLVQGFSAVAAYEKAGYKRHSGNACTLSKHPEVEARLEEIRADMGAPLSQGAEQTGFPFGTNAIAARANVTAESLIEKAQAIQRGAYDSRQFGACVSALKEEGVLSGHRIERSEVGLPGEFDHLSDQELRDEIVREVRELGLILVESSERQHEGDCSKK
jgi:hypothetical protein